MQKTKEITLVLTHPEALVLFDLLARWAETDAPSIPLSQQAEWRVLWDMLAVLESTLPDVFLPDYQDRVAAARELVRGAQEAEE